jgi:hypothetical protein
MPDAVEVYVKKKRLAEAYLKGADKDSIARLATDLALTMGVKHYSISTRKPLRTLDEVMAAFNADGRVNIDNATVPPDLLARMKEAKILE